MKGIDISSYQGNVDFQQVKNDGVEVVIIKASEGKTWQDSGFAQYYDGAKSAGLKVGAYHFLRANESIDEVNNFLSVIGDRHFDCKVVIDAETDFGSVDLNSAKVRQFADILISKGLEVCLYSGEYFYNHNLNDTVKVLPLWVAKYSSNNPSVGKDYVGWQYSSTARVAGISGNVDINEFNDGILIGGVSAQPIVRQVSTPEPAPDPAKVQLQMLLNQAHKTDYEGKELVVDGKIGPRTLSALAKSTFKQGDKDAIIAWIQRRLGIPDDMDFGPQTKNAVIAFQRAHGLADDGIVGPKTWAALVQ